MATIGPVPESQLDPSLLDLYSQASERLPQFLNQIQTLAHHPRIAHYLIQLYLGFLDHSCVDRRLIELAIVTVSYENQCQYCVSHHMPLLSQTGMNNEALRAIQDGAAETSEHLSEDEKLVVTYARQVTRDARRIPSSIMADLKARLTDEQLVELTVRIGLANFFNRLNDALQIDLEAGIQPLLPESDRTGDAHS